MTDWIGWYSTSILWSVLLFRMLGLVIVKLEIDCKGIARIIDDFVEDCVGGLMDWIDEVSTFTVD